MYIRFLSWILLFSDSKYAYSPAPVARKSVAAFHVNGPMADLSRKLLAQRRWIGWAARRGRDVADERRRERESDCMPGG